MIVAASNYISNLQSIAVAAALIIAAAIVALDRFGLLPKRLGPADMVAQLEFSESQRKHVEAELTAAHAKAAALEQTRSLEPLLPLLQQVSAVADAVAASADLNRQTLEKLASFNGTLTHLEDGLRSATEGLKLVAGIVVGVSDTPIKGPPRPAAKRRPTPTKRKDS